MDSTTEKHDIIYKKLADVLNIKFKAHLKGTEIYFSSFYLMKNIITDKEDYFLILEDSISIKFSNSLDFLNQFISIIKLKMEALDEEYKRLQSVEKTNLVIDENEMFLRHEHIGYCGTRLQKLLNKFQEISDDRK